MGVIFGYDNEVPGAAAITGSSEAYLSPASNVKDPRLGVKWASDAETTPSIVFDFGVSPPAISCVGLFGVEYADGITPGAGRVYYDDSITFSAATYHTITDYSITDTTFQTFAVQTKRYWRVQRTLSSSSVLKFGHVFLGSYFETTNEPPNQGIKWGYTDTSKVSAQRFGAKFSDVGEILRTLDLNFRAETHTEFASFRTMAETVGKHSPVVVGVGYPTSENKYAMLAYFTKMMGASHVVGDHEATYWDMKMRLEESK